MCKYIYNFVCICIMYIYNIITNITQPPQNRKTETWKHDVKPSSIAPPASPSRASRCCCVPSDRLRPRHGLPRSVGTGARDASPRTWPRDQGTHFGHPGRSEVEKIQKRLRDADDLWMIFGSSSHVFWKKLETFNWVEPLASVSGDPLEGDWRFWREQEPRLQLWQMSGFWMVKAANATAWPSDHLYKWHKPKTTGALTIWVDQRIGMNWVWAP